MQVSAMRLAAASGRIEALFSSAQPPPPSSDELGAAVATWYLAAEELGEVLRSRSHEKLLDQIVLASPASASASASAASIASHALEGISAAVEKAKAALQESYEKQLSQLDHIARLTSSATAN
uniref:Uncharacterized protein n=1 Tax=Coccolithus braarudii TaxID=221442 RepID=A0A7S0LJT1_9EUKA